jgi:hypothetical protein
MANIKANQAARFNIISNLQWLSDIKKIKGNINPINPWYDFFDPETWEHDYTNYEGLLSRTEYNALLTFNHFLDSILENIPDDDYNYESIHWLEISKKAKDTLLLLGWDKIKQVLEN